MLLSEKSGPISFSPEQEVKEDGYHGMTYYQLKNADFTIRLQELNRPGFQAELITLRLKTDDLIYFRDLPGPFILLNVFCHSITLNLSRNVKREIHDRGTNLFYSTDESFSIRFQKDRNYLLTLVHYTEEFAENHLEEADWEIISGMQNTGFYNSRSGICTHETLELLSMLLMSQNTGPDDDIWEDEIARALLVDFLEKKDGGYQPAYLKMQELEAFYSSRERLVEMATRNVSFSKLLALAEIKDIYMFRKRLSQLYGLNIREFITETRLAKAGDLLRDPALSVKEVAAMTGFKNAFYFSRVFTRYFGQSPKSFRS
jgi:hypothetical protein